MVRFLASPSSSSTSNIFFKDAFEQYYTWIIICENFFKYR